MLTATIDLSELSAGVRSMAGMQKSMLTLPCLYPILIKLSCFSMVRYQLLTTGGWDERGKPQWHWHAYL